MNRRLDTETADEPPVVLVCNGGSSSLKLASFRADRLQRLSSTTLEGNQAELLARLEDIADTTTRPSAILHRVVHAGRVSQPIAALTERSREAIAHWSHLAPQHNLLVLASIDLLQASLAGVPQFVVYDSGLYRDLPELARRYALPPDLDRDWPILRYGFHGLAHQSQWSQIPDAGGKRVITVQLGGGCSVTAWQDGRVVDTTMGFSPLDGLPMASRSGALDPGIVLHLLREGRYTPDSLHELLQRESGLRGLSQISADMRTLSASADPAARFAIDYFCYQVRKQIGAFCFALGGLDCLVFGGGIAENHPSIRHTILQGLDALGLLLCPQRNQTSGQFARLHDDRSRVDVYLAPVDEMTEMARLYQELIES